MVDVEKLRRELAESRSAQQDYRLVAALPAALTELEQLRAAARACLLNAGLEADEQCADCGGYDEHYPDCQQMAEARRALDRLLNETAESKT